MGLLSRVYGVQFWTRVHLAGSLRRLRGVVRSRVPAEPGNVLLVIAGLLGDSVMCTPVLTAARRLWPHAKITVLGKQGNRDLLGEIPAIDRFWIAPAVPFSLRKRRQLRQLDAMLASGNFDLAIILLGDEFAPALERAGIPVRVGVAGHPLTPFLTHTYEIRSAREWGPDQRLNALRVLGYEVSESLPALRTNPSTAESARQILLACGAKTDAYAVIHPFGSSARQHWPLSNLDELASMLRQQHGLELVLAGGPEWRGLSGNISPAVVNTVGCLKLPELMAMIENARIAITTDSGPFHIAGALSRPTVGLFRKSRPEHAQRYPCAQVLLGSVPQCEGRCQWDWCRATPCASMQAINVAKVVEQVERTLKGSPPDREMAER